jgi:DNA-binding LytR/AlgR family response regulator
MLHIAICEDDRREAANLRKLLEQFAASSGVELSCTIYESGFALADAAERRPAFDIILLDVMMPGLNGLETAAEIRRGNDHVKIIFLTSSSEFAVASYAVDAYFYMLKPLCENTFFRIMNKACKEIQAERSSSIVVHNHRSIAKLFIAELAYCEIINKTIYYHLATGRVLDGPGSMSELEQKLSPYPFIVKIHRSYMVNLRHVQSLTGKEITMMTKDILPLSRGRFDSIKRAFLSLPFEGGHA